MRAVVSAASVLAIAAGANAAQFQFVSAEGGGGVPGIDGAGFSTSMGGFFHADGTPDLLADNASNYTAANFREFDSYFTIDSFGPSARGRAGADDSVATRNFYGDYPPAAPFPPGDYNAETDLIIGPGSHISDPLFANGDPIDRAEAGWAINPSPDPFVVSGFAPDAMGGRSNLDGVFLARLTVNSGAALSGGILAAVDDGGIVLGEVFLGGGGVQIGSQTYVLSAFLVAQPEISVLGFAGGNLGDGGGSFGAADVYDVWFHVIPTPGAMALLGIGGLATLRRRRS